MDLVVVYDRLFLDHDTGGGDHPELPERLNVIYGALLQGPLSEKIEELAPQPVSRAQLLSFHEEGWLFRFEESVLSGKTYIDHTDNQVGFESYDIALLSAGAGITAIDALESGRKSVFFCLNRPPGHHAEPNRPFGFCFFNNCAIAARHWQQQYDRKKVCIIDFDAHHGNGIQTCCEMDPDLLYISIHEHPSFSYPGTGYAEEKGLGPGKGSIVNLPLMPGAGDEQLLQLLPGIEKQLSQFSPDAMVIAAGFDGHRQDDMAGLHYSTEVYGQLGKVIGQWAQAYCRGRLISILEGGYELSVLAESVETYLLGLLQSFQQ